MKETKIEIPQFPAEHAPKPSPEHENKQEVHESSAGKPLFQETGGLTEVISNKQPAQQPVIPQKIDPEIRQIENILAEGMDTFFTSLTLQKQREFKSKGEETAQKIKSVIHKSKYSIKEVINLIIGWLKTLPGINNFFLEQEAKIKADSIIRNLKK